MTPTVFEYGAAFTNGDGFFEMFRNSSGDSEMGVTGSLSAPVFYEVTPATSKPEKTLHIHRINFKVLDGMMRWDKFAGIDALTNGIRIDQIRPAAPTAQIKDFSAANTIKDNADWALVAGVDTIRSVAPGSDDLLAVRWTISNAGLPLLMGPGEMVRLTIQDDLTEVTSFEAMAQGVYV